MQQFVPVLAAENRTRYFRANYTNEGARVDGQFSWRAPLKSLAWSRAQTHTHWVDTSNELEADIDVNSFFRVPNDCKIFGSHITHSRVLYFAGSFAATCRRSIFGRRRGLRRKGSGRRRGRMEGRVTPLSVRKKYFFLTAHGMAHLPLLQTGIVKQQICSVVVDVRGLVDQLLEVLLEIAGLGVTWRLEHCDAPSSRRRGDVPFAVDAKVVRRNGARSVGDIHPGTVVRVGADQQRADLRVKREVSNVDVTRRPEDAAGFPVQATVRVQQYPDALEVRHQFVGAVDIGMKKIATNPDRYCDTMTLRQVRSHFKVLMMVKIGWEGQFHPPKVPMLHTNYDRHRLLRLARSPRWHIYNNSQQTIDCRGVKDNRMLITA